MSNLTIYSALGAIAMAPLDNCALSAAPQAAIMIQSLSILAACTVDTSLINSKTSSGIRLLKSPGSFRASLFQTITTMREAFQTAHQAMFRIKIKMDDVPLIMASLVRAYANPNDPGARLISQLQLEKLEKAVKACSEEAGKVRQKFEDAQKLIEELIEVTAATVGDNEERMIETKELLAVYEEHRSAAQQETKRLQDAIKKQKDKIRKTSSKLRKSTESWKTVAAVYAEGYRTMAQIMAGKMVNGSGESARHLFDYYNNDDFSSATNAFEKAKELAKKMSIHQKRLEEVLVKEQAANRDLLAGIAGKLATTGIEKLNMEDVIYYLSTGLKVLNGIQKKWERLQNYFVSMESVILGPITDDLSYVDTLLSTEEVRNSSLTRNELAINCIKVAGNCMNIGNSAGLYTEISDKLVMPDVDIASVKMTMTPDEVNCQIQLPNMHRRIEKKNRRHNNFIGRMLHKSEMKVLEQLISARDIIDEAFGSGQIRVIL